MLGGRSNGETTSRALRPLAVVVALGVGALARGKKGKTSYTVIYEGINAATGNG